MHGTPINSTALCARGKIVGLGPHISFLHHGWQEMVGKCSGSDTNKEEKMVVQWGVKLKAWTCPSLVLFGSQIATFAFLNVLLKSFL